MNQLTERYAEAVGFAIEAHDEQVRKGTDITYVSHLLAVSALVLEYGGDEDLAIAGLLHDAVEDAHVDDRDDETMEEHIRDAFGDRVADVVVGCSDTDVVPKPPWRERKERYLTDLLDAPPEVLLVSACDKLHNARCTVADFRAQGPTFWERFHAGPADQRWYYATLLEVFRRRFADDPTRHRLLAELERTIGELAALVDDAVLSDWPAELRGGSATTCPSCGEGNARPIIWGMPSPELMDAVHQGLIDVELGGCCVTEDDPTHSCRSCGLQFREERSTAG
jgi:HD domain